MRALRAVAGAALVYFSLLLISLPAASSPCGPETPDPGSVHVASFNIKWIGYYENERDNEGLANLLAHCDIVVIQELVAPPDLKNAEVGKPVNWPEPLVMEYPNGKALKPDNGSTEFFKAMKGAGFDAFVLSEQDTGPGDKLHVNRASTEWFVAFYKTARACSAWDSACYIPAAVPRGFLARDLSANGDYERVPYAFPFRVGGTGKTDFVLISVHLQPNDSSAAETRRAHELRAIAGWIGCQNGDLEADYVILGDMNIQDCEELGTVTPAGFLSLNDECRDTVPSKADKPYDHVMFRPASTKEIDTVFDLKVIDLLDAMRPRWSVVGNGPYPGDPYKSRVFPTYFSDHHPVVFRITIEADDDGS